MCTMYRPCWVLAKSYAAGECISLEFARAEARRNALRAEGAAYARRDARREARVRAEAAAAYTETEARVRAETAAYAANTAAYATNEGRAARTRALLAAAVGVGVGVGAGVGGGGGGGAALARPAEPTLQAAPSAPPVITVIARTVPSAHATLVSPAEAALYETAETEATSSAV